ncbi:hypothetical protein KM043_006525 [Ampulex compressa]|nr:hypothetical protein KM043_006525 [Ampulex compressa]
MSPALADQTERATTSVRNKRKGGETRESWGKSGKRVIFSYQPPTLALSWIKTLKIYQRRRSVCTEGRACCLKNPIRHSEGSKFSWKTRGYRSREKRLNVAPEKNPYRDKFKNGFPPTRRKPEIKLDLPIRFHVRILSLSLQET